MRNGKRFERGDEFTPAPNFEQASRLVAAGCLPEEAMKHVAGPKNQAEAALEERAARDRQQEKARQEAARRAASQRTGKIDQAGVARTQVNEDGLFEETIASLTDIATAEKIDLGGATKKADIIAAIRTARAAKAAA
ncbi:MAG TPA: hypothetical protein VMF90_14800 [Rhizobiaceae bacterium]|nr:hypothetical protein [Rhizobiaceae bacterium]